MKLKRLAALLLAGMLALSVTACADKSNKDDDDDKNDYSSSADKDNNGSDNGNIDPPSASEEYEAVVKSFVKFIETGEVEYIKACYTDETWAKLDKLSWEYEGCSFGDFYLELRSEKNDYSDYADVKTEYEITEKDEADEDDLSNFVDYYVSDIGYDKDDIVIDKGYYLTVEVIVYGDGKEIRNMEDVLPVIRVNGKWEIIT